jgi:hypothetical protein
MKILLLAVLAFILLDVLLVAYVIYRRSRQKLSEKAVHEIREAWKKLIRIADQRLAVMEADKLLDHALASLGYKGNLGSKLKVSGGKFKNINKVWAAHKVRNNIAHQINYALDEKTYRATMLAFKEAFKDLQIF